MKSLADNSTFILPSTDYLHWRTANGTIIHIHEMTTQHIQNCISELESGNLPHKFIVMHGQQWYDVLHCELERREIE